MFWGKCENKTAQQLPFEKKCFMRRGFQIFNFRKYNAELDFLVVFEVLQFNASFEKNIDCMYEQFEFPPSTETE